jgi:hypothetical protein
VKIEFSDVKRGECILIPGNIVVMERMEKAGHLLKYMTDHLDWIGRTFITKEGFVCRICTLFTSFLTIPQL